MCLVLFAHRLHPRYPLILGANRDEFHHRPTLPLHEWPDEPGLFAGRDLQRGGTWFGITRELRWAAVTNYRESETRQLPSSRGHLVTEFLTGDLSAREYLRTLRPRQADFSGFNLLVGDTEEVFWMSNRSEGMPDGPLSPGLYGVSNALLDTPWPKISRGKIALDALLNSDSDLVTGLLSALSDPRQADEADLPDTGVGPALERMLSPAFICSPEYGTRSSLALVVEGSGRFEVAERSYSPSGQVVQEIRLRVPN